MEDDNIRKSVGNLKSLNQASIDELLDKLFNKYLDQIETIPQVTKIFTQFVRRESNIHKQSFDWEHQEKKKKA